MHLGLLGVLFSNPLLFILMVVSLILSLSVHEFSHALAATKLGDPTAKSLGRLTLNPLAHLDPIGTLLLVLVGFGWGKPVPFNPYYLKNPKVDSALISFAGPLSNFILAIFFVICLKILPINTLTLNFFYLMVIYNLTLGVFNLLPIHPLDGFKVVNGFLSDALSYQWMQMAPYGIYILIVLMMTNTTSEIIGTVTGFLMRIFGLSNL